MIKFVLILTKQGQTRLSHYYEPVELADRPTLEADVIRRILARPPGQVGIMCDKLLQESKSPPDDFGHISKSISPIHFI